MNSEILKYAKMNGYFVDKKGNVFSSTKQLALSKRTDKSNYSYFRFSMRYYGKRVNISVHRFIAYFKFGEDLFNDGVKVRHLDSNSLNNSWDNIEIGTHADNMLDVPKEVRIEKAIKASEKRRKFSDEEVQQILDDRDSGFTYKMLCDKYNTSKSTLSYLFNKAYYTGARKVVNYESI